MISEEHENFFNPQHKTLKASDFNTELTAFQQLPKSA